MFSNTKKILLLVAIVLGSCTSNDVLAGRNRAFGFIRFVSPHDPERKVIYIPTCIKTHDDATTVVAKQRDAVDSFVREYQTNPQSYRICDDKMKQEIEAAYRLILEVLQAQGQ